MPLLLNDIVAAHSAAAVLEQTLTQTPAKTENASYEKCDGEPVTQ